MRYRGSYFPDGSTQYIDSFGGLDLRNRIANNAFSEMLNMSPEGAPELVTRAYRYLSQAKFGEGEIVDAITTVTVRRPESSTLKEEPAYVLQGADKFALVFGADGDETDRGFFSVDLTPYGYYGYGHSLAVIGRKLVVAPEMIVVDLDTGDVESVNVTATATQFAFTDVDLTDFGDEINERTTIYSSGSANHPDTEEIEWLIEMERNSYIAMVGGRFETRYDENGNEQTYRGYEIRICSSADGWNTHTWRTPNKYLKLFTADAAKLHKGEAVTISGTGSSLDGDYIIFAVGAGFIVINAEFSGAPFDYCPAMSTNGGWRRGVDWDGRSSFGYTSEGQEIVATITRKAPPVVQHICESGNRIWWCGFGTSDGDVINEIGCSKQGDPLNYYAIATGDSWITNVGPAGDFTGACEVGGTPVLFKENCVYEVGGSLPSSFRTTRRDLRGIEQDSSGALCVSGGAVYYQGSDGPRVYGGSYSQRLTAAFGNTDINAAAFAEVI